MLPQSCPFNLPQTARMTSTAQMTMPAVNSACQNRPSSKYSQPWWPNQNQYWPNCALMPKYSPTMEPTATSTTAPKSTLTQKAWCLGSRLPMKGAMKSPAASQAVAIQKMESCKCQVRVMVVGNMLRMSMP